MSQIISHRIVSKKRHTSGYVINGVEYTRAQAIKLARKGDVKGVRVAKGPSGSYLVSTSDKSLYSLPTRVGTGRRRRATTTSR